jgi:predicted permease
MGWLGQLFSRRRRYDELSESIREHLDEKTADMVDRGMTRQEAERKAHREFGNVTRIEERSREVWQWPTLESIWLDMRFAFRQLHKSPGFAFTAVLTLALGIGATAAIFSVVDAVILRPLPYSDVNRIASIQTYSPSGYWQKCSWQGYLAMRKLNQTFDAVAGWADYWGMTLKTSDQTRYLNVNQVTDNFFDVFGVKPVLGRAFVSGEDQPGKNNVVVLSYEVWRQSFNADDHVIGKVVHLSGDPYVVIGVMPAGFRFPYGRPDLVYIPVHVRPNWVGSWRDHWLMTVGRMRSGVSIQQASADMAHVMQEIGQEKPDSDKGRTAALIPISVASRGQQEGTELALMLGAVLAVLLIACANVASLLLARSITREHEMALRVAIGAARARLVRQLLIENALIGLMGAGAGILLAEGMLVTMKAFLAHAFMRGGNVRLNISVMAVTLGISLFSGIGVGLIPAWRAAKAEPSRALKSGTTTGTTRHQHGLRAGFVVLQITLSLVLVVFSGLVLLTLQRMMRANIGFDPQHLLILNINIPAGDYKGRNYVNELMTPLEQSVDAIPGVKAAGFIDQPPALGYGSETTMSLVGQPQAQPDQEQVSESRTVTAGYYAALGLPILRGRNFDSLDTPQSRPVVIVNEAWVKEFLPKGKDPLVQAFQQKNGHNMAIAGVAGDARQLALEPAHPEIDFPFSRFGLEDQQDAGSFSVCMFVRTLVPPQSIVSQLRKALHDIAPAVAFQTPETMDEALNEVLINNRMESWVFGIFASIAVLLVIVGIYGLLTQEVISQTRDIGVRMALGASRQLIARLMMMRVAMLLGIGIGIGLLLIVLLRRAVSSIVAIQFGRDGAIIAAFVVLFALIGFLAALIPTHRAATVDPMRALRNE